MWRGPQCPHNLEPFVQVQKVSMHSGGGDERRYGRSARRLSRVAKPCARSGGTIVHVCQEVDLSGWCLANTQGDVDGGASFHDSVF